MLDETHLSDQGLAAQEALRALLASQARLDALSADLASAHLDAAIHALCEQFAIQEPTAAEA